MRFDKDALIKHHFWILLALFVLLWGASVAMIKASDAGDAKKKDFEAAKTGITGAGAKGVKNAKFNEPWQKYGARYLGEKNKLWADAWELQKDLYTWPSSQAAPLDQLKYPDDEIKYHWRITYKNELWTTQYKNLEKVVAPVEFVGGTPGFEKIIVPGKGGLQAVGGGGGAGFRGRNVGAAPAAGPGELAALEGYWKSVPTEEECWLAQEDFWVKRELLYIIRDAVHNVGRLHEDKEAAKGKPLPEGIAARHVFRNNLWEIEFLLEHKGRQWLISDHSSIKNIHPAKRIAPLAGSPSSGGLHFLVEQGDRKIPFRVEGEPLQFGQSAEFRRKTEIDSIDFRKPFGLEQDFEFVNCPIKQIIDIQVGKHGHRTSGLSLLPSLLIKPKMDDTPAKPAGGAPPPGVAGKGPAAAAAVAAGGGAAGGTDLTPNGLPRNRYIAVSEQCRHIPVALHLVVDQSQLHEVLAATTNSRLRVQTTQVQFRHIGGVQSRFADAGSGTRTPSGPSPGRFRAGATVGAAPVASSEDDPNLLEVAIYGIATLYERYPPKNAAAEPGKPGAGGQPAPAAPGQAPPPAGTPPGATPPVAKAPEAAKGPAAGKTPAPPTAPGAAKDAKAPEPAKAAAAEAVKAAAKDGKAPEPAKAAEPPKPADKGKDGQQPPKP